MTSRVLNNMIDQLMQWFRKDVIQSGAKKGYPNNKLLFDRYWNDN